MSMDFEAWRCSHDERKFCPDEGCPVTGRSGEPYGCARDHGWKPGDPTPYECGGPGPVDLPADVERGE